MRKLKQIISVIPVIIILLYACEGFNNGNENLPVAKVYNKYLYKSELAKQMGNLGQGMSGEDSVELARSYIDRWLRQQLMLHQAEMNLTEEEKEVSMELEDYRAKLLIYKYQQRWINKNLDTVIDSSAVKDYYNTYSSNFKLDNSIIKGLYIKLSKVSPDINRVNYWIRSDSEDAGRELIDYSRDYAAELRVMDKSWVPLHEILSQFNQSIDDPENFLRYRNYFHAEDEQYHYYIKIDDYKLKGEVAPLDYVKDNIKLILLNKRKIRQINELESSTYNNALNREQFKIYE